MNKLFLTLFALFLILGLAYAQCDPECTTDQICHVDQCVATVCPEGTECHADYDCVEGKCVEKVDPEPECTTDADCEGELVCDEGKCVEKVDPEPECATDADCEGELVCVEEKCVEKVDPEPTTVVVRLLEAKFSRGRVDDGDAPYNSLNTSLKNALATSVLCKPYNAGDIKTAKNTIAFYVAATCTDDEVAKIQQQIQPAPEPEAFAVLADYSAVTVELAAQDAGEISTTCITGVFTCGTEECPLTCEEGAACTKDNEKAVCGDYQKCVIDENSQDQTGRCNSSMAISTFVAIALAVVAALF